MAETMPSGAPGDSAADDRKPEAAQNQLEHLLRLGTTAAREGRHKQAQEYLEQVLEIDQDQEDAWLWLAAISQDLALARAIYRRVLGRNPGSERAAAALRQLEQGQSREQADVVAATGQAQEPASPQQTSPREETALSTSEGQGEDDTARVFVPPWEIEAPVSPTPEPEAAQSEPHRDTSAVPAEPVESAQPPPIAEDVTDIAVAGAEATAASAETGPAETALPRPESMPETMHTSEAEPTHDSLEPVVPVSVAATNGLPERGPQQTAPKLIRPANWEPLRRTRFLRHLAMFGMLGFVMLGSLSLVFVAGSAQRTDQVRMALGVMTATPTITPSPTRTLTPTVTPTHTATIGPSPTPSFTPSLVPSITPTYTPAPPTATPTPDWVSAKYLPLPVKEKWIEVDLSEQTLIAYDGMTIVFTTKISSGRSRTPTVLGKFRIQRKFEAQLMTGPGYYLPNVPYVMYFYGGYALHGAYWHNNWGTPMSHGCVNLRREDAKWLYEWTDPVVPKNAKSVYAGTGNTGTWVLVHP